MQRTALRAAADAERWAAMAVVRKSIAVLLIVLVLAIPIGSLFVEWRLFGGAFGTLAYSVFGLGALVSVVNFYLSYIFNGCP